jgi:hypothetical protein
MDQSNQLFVVRENTYADRAAYLEHLTAALVGRDTRSDKTAALLAEKRNHLIKELAEAFDATMTPPPLPLPRIQRYRRAESANFDTNSEERGSRLLFQHDTSRRRQVPDVWSLPTRPCEITTSVVHAKDFDVIGGRSVFIERSGGFLLYDPTTRNVKIQLFALQRELPPLFEGSSMEERPIEVPGTFIAAIALQYDFPPAPCVGRLHWIYGITAYASFRVFQGRAKAQIWYYPGMVQPDVTVPLPTHSLFVGQNAPVLLESETTRPVDGSMWDIVSGEFDLQPGQRSRVWVACGVKMVKYPDYFGDDFGGWIQVGDPTSYFDAAMEVSVWPDMDRPGMRYLFEPL